MSGSFVVNVADARAYEHPIAGVTSTSTPPGRSATPAARYGAATPEPTSNGDVAYSDWPQEYRGADPPWRPR